MKNNLLVILYPVSAFSITSEKKLIIIDVLKKELKNVKDAEIDEALNSSIKSKEVKSLIKEIDKSRSSEIFNVSRKVLQSFDYSKKHLIRIAEIGKGLKIGKNDTGFKFDIYNLSEINNYEFKKTLKRFSTVSAAVGFIPLPIADIAILTPIQVGMIAKISNIYEFKLEPIEFLKMIGGIVGAGIIFRVTAKLINNFIPIIGWGINSVIAFAGTYALGILAKSYIEANGVLTAESIKDIWEKSFKEGKGEFGNLKDYIFSKKDELLKEMEKIKKASKENKDKKNDNKKKDNKTKNQKTRVKKENTEKKDSDETVLFDESEENK